MFCLFYEPERDWTLSQKFCKTLQVDIEWYRKIFGAIDFARGAAGLE